MAEALKNLGYQTALSGKWHLGQKAPNRPIDRGFDVYYGLMDGCCNFFNPTHHLRVEGHGFLVIMIRSFVALFLKATTPPMLSPITPSKPSANLPGNHNRSCSTFLIRLLTTLFRPRQKTLPSTRENIGRGGRQSVSNETGGWSK